MGYKNIMISNPTELTIKDQQLKIDEVKIPLEDINCILLENRSIKVSAYFLQQLAELGVALYICDSKHIPNAVLLPLVRHSRHYKMLKYQIDIAKPFQKRLWQQLVIQKILNQAKCLELNGIEGYEELQGFSNQVQSGDKTNIEAKAASFYFRRLFGTNFTRSDENVVNSMLNYGYAIIRGIVARSIVCYGFEPSIGLFHHSELNSFNLADDFIEPFRPVIDLYVSQKYDCAEVESDLTPAMKRELFTLISCDVNVRGEIHSVSNAVDKLIMSFSSCLSGARADLLMPELMPLKMHEYE